MLKRYLRLKNDLKKASLDSKAIKDKNINDDSIISAIEELVYILQPFDEATKSLSCKGIILHTVDMILQILIEKLSGLHSLKQKLVQHINERRCVWSDIILYLKNDHEGISLYQEPQGTEIESLYKFVIL